MAEAKGRRPLPSKRASGRPRRATSFYRQVLSEAERLALPEAEEIQGLDQEIALLRVKLRTALEERPEDLKLMLKGIELLVRALSTRYRLPRQSQEDLSEAIRGVLREVGGPLFPELLGDAA